jgi:hypothetical protein
LDQFGSGGKVASAFSEMGFCTFLNNFLRRQSVVVGGCVAVVPVLIEKDRSRSFLTNPAERLNVIHCDTDKLWKGNLFQGQLQKVVDEVQVFVVSVQFFLFVASFYDFRFKGGVRFFKFADFFPE